MKTVSGMLLMFSHVSTGNLDMFTYLLTYLLIEETVDALTG